VINVCDPTTVCIFFSFCLVCALSVGQEHVYNIVKVWFVVK
jgi:hypothetical protein